MKDPTVKAKVFKDVEGFTAMLSFSNGVEVIIESPTWRKLVNKLHEFGFSLPNGLYEFELPEAMGFLERALR